MKMIADMLYVKQAIDGGKDKHIVTDKVTGDKYQKYGHLSDTCLIMGTKVLTSDGNKSIEDIRRGDLVLTRTGYHEVTNIKCMGYKDVCTYRIGDKEITCTEDHKIFAGDQFIMVSSLIAKNILCIFAIKKTWKERLLSMMGLSFTDTPKHNDPVIGITLRDGQSKTESGKKQHFTDLYGRNITERLRKGLQFITSTGTSVITGLKTYLSLHIRNTSEDITSEVHKNTKICLKECCETKHNPKQPSGMVLMPEENGIKNTQKLQFTESHTKWIVRSVKRVSYQGSETHRYIVQEDVSQDMLPGWQEMLKSTTKTERAFIAEKHSAPINGIKLQPVLASVQQIGEKKNAIVYDITINGAHEYFANGILVHNCDYLITEAFNNYFEA